MFKFDYFQLHVDVFILVWDWASSVYLLFLHVQRCVVAGCSGLLGLCFFGMATLHFSLINSC